MNPVPGITIGNVNIVSATELTVDVTAVGPFTYPTPASIWVTSGTQEAVAPNVILLQ